MTRIRKIKNRDLPPNLYKRNGYYSYRDPRTRKEYGLGRNKAYAINEAISANQLLLNTEKVKPLTERIDGQGSVYFHEFLDRYEEILKTRGLREKTLKDYKQRIGVIRKGFVNAPIQNITTKEIADFLQLSINEERITTAKLMRSLLNDCFREAISLGLIQINPVTSTKTPKIKIQRARLSLEDFNTILGLINNGHHWLTHAMKLALVTGQRVSDVSKIKYKDIHDGKLWIIQQKTGSKIAIPLDIELYGIKLSKTIADCVNNSEFVINNNGNKITVERISKEFRRFRDISQLNWVGEPPSFHEIRSLSARLYTETMGSNFAQKLLGHKSATMTAKYQDDRNNSWIEI
ncbi:tyrosine-type recombinase/integrase [Arsenophonus nasoniae]|uniref:Phage integrase family protein n=1 Tax=Arsenophonus nasoniae TaxID=638 RepID=A0A4P7KT80_9GAMM|nr:tyrosine-type recombinase/integrase [Arsenophonus nasoniae]QBY43191.1 Phage integrase family protein [Arsenophonus nasoniae]WGM07210.1 tyrosine-type recombinase/integrase [Arsenophonus nasoniae]WGM12088.1 tyrosine-type recombinase/integrase [Arsenophonus nasoniae]WGM16771.1 tyrosine-type recombinase/integrase [Arsenophonus nasoniae]